MNRIIAIKVFAATEGEDPDWPLWYSDHLLERMHNMLKAKFTKSELIYMLVKADKKMGRRKESDT